MVAIMRVRSVVLVLQLAMVGTILHLYSRSGDDTLGTHRFLLGLWELTFLEVDIDVRHPNDVQGKYMFVSTKKTYLSPTNVDLELTYFYSYHVSISSKCCTIFVR
jgi:hypothetical protein